MTISINKVANGFHVELRDDWGCSCENEYVFNSFADLNVWFAQNHFEEKEDKK